MVIASLTVRLLQVPMVTSAAPGRAMRRVSSVPSRAQSPAYASGFSPGRSSLRGVPAGGAYGSPIVTEPRPLASVFSSTLPPASRGSPATLRPLASAGRTSSPPQGLAPGRRGSPLTVLEGAPPLTQQPGPGTLGAPAGRSSMTAVPQHCSSSLPRSLHRHADPYAAHGYDVYERMVPGPDSLTGEGRTCTHTHTHTQTSTNTSIVHAHQQVLYAPTHTGMHN